MNANLRYFKMLLKFRHPRLSYFDNFTPAYTRPIVKHNLSLVYAILGAFVIFEVQNYQEAQAAYQKTL